MYELPEIETLRRDLDKETSGRKVKTVEVTSNDVIPGAKSRKAFAGSLEGRKLGAWKRVGLVLYSDIGEDELLAVDVSGGAQVLKKAPKDAVDSGTVMTISFTQGGQLRVVDPDHKAEVAVIAADDLLAFRPNLPTLGLDPIEEPISWVDFGRRVLPRKDKLKNLLTSSDFVIGLGPVYSDEILHSALLRGDRTADSLTTQEVRRLYRAVVETLHLAMKHRGTSVDSGFTDLFGEAGTYDPLIEVYGRVGQRSSNGRGEVLKMRIGNQTHFHADYQV